MKTEKANKMVAPIHSEYSNKKGIYKDLYREIEADNKKKSIAASLATRPKKGIYAKLYRQIEEDKAAIMLKESKVKKDIDKQNSLYKYSSILLYYTGRLEEISKFIFGNFFAKINLF